MAKASTSKLLGAKGAWGTRLNGPWSSAPSFLNPSGFCRAGSGRSTGRCAALSDAGRIPAVRSLAKARA